MSAAVLLQTAVYSALSGVVSVPVYDDVPQFETSQDASFPFVVIGEDSFSDWGDDAKTGYDASLQIHVWTRGQNNRGRLECKQIQGEIYDALHRQNIAIGDYGTLGFDETFQESQLDNDGITRHGIQRFRVLFAEPHDFKLGNC